MADLLQPLPTRSLGDRVAALRRSPALGPVAAAGGAAAGLLALVVVGVVLLRSAAPTPRLTLPRAEPGSAPVVVPVSGPGSTATAGSPATAVTVTVHVAGQVVHPGVYALAAGDRVADAIVAAGGPSAQADGDQLNLAARVADGERIYVPKQGEPVPPQSGPGGGAAATGPPSGPVDLNSATAEQLDALPGVGPATSAAIITYRTSHGRFRSVTELLEVPGIGPAKLEALRPLVRV